MYYCANRDNGACLLYHWSGSAWMEKEGFYSHKMRGEVNGSRPQKNLSQHSTEYSVRSNIWIHQSRDYAISSKSRSPLYVTVHSCPLSILRLNWVRIIVSVRPLKKRHVHRTFCSYLPDWIPIELPFGTLGRQRFGDIWGLLANIRWWYCWPFSSLSSWKGSMRSLCDDALLL